MRFIFALLFALCCGPALAQVTPGTSPLSIAKGGTAGATAAAARTNLGVTATGADTTYNFRANNLNDVANAGTARSNLGVAIGSNVEAWDNDLDCLAALSSTGVIKRTGAGTCSAGGVALSDLATGTQDTVIGYFGSTAASALAIGNCANALTYSTSTHTFGCNSTAGTGTVTTAGTGLSLTGGGSTLNLALTNATLQASPANPTSSGSATGVMMGTGTTCKITPVYSGRIKFGYNGDFGNAALGNGTTTKLFFGTGTAPANGAAITGTQIGNQHVLSVNGSTNPQVPFQHGGIVTGLSTGTQYWFDISLAASSSTSVATNLSCDAFEF